MQSTRPTKKQHHDKTKTPAPRQAKAAPSRGETALPASAPWISLLLLAFFVYLPALQAGFSWDDNALTENPLVKSAAGLVKIWTNPSVMPHEQHYWPLVYSSFWLEHCLAGLEPLLYHLDNILLHCAVTLLLWRVLVFLELPGAWLAAALFAVHPVHAESVAWVIERKDVLSGVFYLGAALAFLKWDGVGKMDKMDSMDGMDRGERKGDACPGMGKRITLYLLSLGLFTAALLSKSIVVTLPVSLGLILWWRHGRLTLRHFFALAPLALLAAALTYADMHYYRGAHYFNGEDIRGVVFSDLAWPARILMAGRGIWVYLSNLLFPWRLATFYPLWKVDVHAALSWLPLLGWLGLLAGLWAARRRIGRGPCVAVAFFSLTLAPALGFVDFDFLRLSWVADRFQYLASAGPLALAAAGVAGLARKRGWSTDALRFGIAGLLLPLVMLGLRQASFYRDPLTLFQASAAAYPECWPARRNLEKALMDAGRPAEAVKIFDETLKQTPPPGYQRLHAIAKVLEEQRQFKDAERYYQETLRLKPDFVDALISYGNCLAEQRRPAEAVAQLREALRLSPDNILALNNLGNALRDLNQFDEALRCLEQATHLDPQNVGFRVNLALVLLDQHDFARVAGECRKVLKLDPDNYMAHFTLGQALLNQRDPKHATLEFAEAARIDPKSAVAYFLLGRSLELQNNLDAAIQCYQQTLRIQPNFAQAADRLRALGIGGR